MPLDARNPGRLIRAPDRVVHINLMLIIRRRKPIHHALLAVASLPVLGDVVEGPLFFRPISTAPDIDPAFHGFSAGDGHDTASALLRTDLLHAMVYSPTTRDDQLSNTGANNFTTDGISKTVHFKIFFFLHIILICQLFSKGSFWAYFDIVKVSLMLPRKN